MKDFFNVRKTSNIVLMGGGILAIFIGLFGAMDTNVAAGLFWIGLGIFCFYIAWKKSGKIEGQ